MGQRNSVNKAIEDFTVGKDRELDLYLAPFDILGSMAHVKMLESIGLIGKDEFHVLLLELKKLYETASAGDFKIEEGVEDVHSQVEFLLTKNLVIWERKFIVAVHVTTRFCLI